MNLGAEDSMFDHLESAGRPQKSVDPLDYLFKTDDEVNLSCISKTNASETTNFVERLNKQKEELTTRNGIKNFKTAALTDFQRQCFNLEFARKRRPPNPMMASAPKVLRTANPIVSIHRKVVQSNFD